MNKISFGRDQYGAVTLLVPDEYEPIDQLLYDDLRGDREILTEILDHARNPAVAWDISSNSCWMSITPDAVTVGNEFSGQSTTLPHSTLIEIIEAYLDELDVADAEQTEISGT